MSLRDTCLRPGLRTIAPPGLNTAVLVLGFLKPPVYPRRSLPDINCRNAISRISWVN